MIQMLSSDHKNSSVTDTTVVYRFWKFCRRRKNLPKFSNFTLFYHLLSSRCRI